MHIVHCVTGRTKSKCTDIQELDSDAVSLLALRNKERKERRKKCQIFVIEKGNVLKYVKNKNNNYFLSMSKRSYCTKYYK